jgi:hypothetical protein
VDAEFHDCADHLAALMEAGDSSWNVTTEIRASAPQTIDIMRG